MSLLLLLRPTAAAVPAIVVSGQFDQPTPDSSDYDGPTPGAAMYDKPTPS